MSELVTGGRNELALIFYRFPAKIRAGGMKMKMGVIGLGSMGKRRVRDLLRLGCEVVGYDISEEKRKESEKMFAIKTALSFDELARQSIQAAVIATPPDCHVEYYEKCFAARVPFFSEAGIFTPQPSWFAERERSSGVSGYPSATWQHHPLFQLARETVVEQKTFGAIHSVHYHYGGYLPFWHPWEDYTAFYAGRKDTCAAREMVPFELEWLTFVFGPVEAVSALKGQLGIWKAEFADSYFLHLRFASGLRGTLNIELHQTAPFRFGTISCHSGQLKLDLLRHEIRQYDLATDSWKIRKMPGMKVLNSFNFEEIYFKEIESFFLSVTEKRPYLKSWAEDRHLSDVLFAAERSAEESRWIQVRDVTNQYSGLTL